jgi:hypothetical protein
MSIYSVEELKLSSYLYDLLQLKLQANPQLSQPLKKTIL